MSRADGKALWRSIKRHVPLIAQRVLQAAYALRMLGMPPTRQALHAAAQLQADGFAVTRTALTTVMRWYKLESSE